MPDSEFRAQETVVKRNPEYQVRPLVNTGYSGNKKNCIF